MNETNAVKRAADAVVEASCLVAVCALPLYFSVLTTTGYEPDKAVLLRVFAIIAGTAWLVGFLAEGRPQRSIATTRPLLWLGLGLFLAYGLSTILSIDPRVSLWGSQARQQGLWTRAAYLIILLVVATRFRHPARRERLIDALLFGSLPVVVYGIVQQLGYDPVPSSGDPTTLAWPVRSSFGQHVFLGSYLVMIIPLTAGRLFTMRDGWSWPVSERTGLADIAKAAGIILFTVVVFFGFCRAGMYRPALFALLPGYLAADVVLLLLLQSLPDSPMLQRARVFGYSALLALQILTLVFTGARASWLGFFASVPVFAILAARRLNRERIWKVALAVTAAGAVFLFLLNIPGGPLQPLRSVQALSRLSNITDSGGAGGSGQGRLLIWRGVMKLMTEDPSVGGHWGGIGRDIVGYGPETMHWAFESVFPLKLRQVTSEIWTWDRAHDIYLDYLVDAGLLGLLLILAVFSLVFWAILRSFRHVPDATAWLLIACAAALAGHLVDGLFSIETTVSLLLLWMLVGLVASPASSREEDVQPLPVQALMEGAAGFWLVLGLAAALLVAWPSAADYPVLLATLWLLTAVTGVGMVASLLVPLAIPQQLTSVRWNRPVAVAAILALLTAIGLGSQARFETAAVAERSGMTSLAEANAPQALTYLQDATQANGYEPQYETELSSAYLSLAGTREDSSDPMYQPSGDDARTIDPQRASGLGRDQLLALSHLSLESARSLAPLDPDVYSNLGNLYLSWNRPEAALAAFRQAARLSLDNPRYIDQQALAQLQAGQARQAETRARTALDLDNTFWYSYYALSLVHHHLGAHQEARQEASQALAWAHNVWSSPPSDQIMQLKSLQQQG